MHLVPILLLFTTVVLALPASGFSPCAPISGDHPPSPLGIKVGSNLFANRAHAQSLLLWIDPSGPYAKYYISNNGRVIKFKKWNTVRLLNVREPTIHKPSI
ncbi:hypothetical protein K440DRAFT_642193 [Wilcoxina mikolae CBS 423.85]|nr:hypothetical protein K440DRAFT_642193 [Wilcoxina mikolae CBS 423.85]